MIRTARLISGLVMFAYVVTHFVNHSLGLISLALMDRALEGVYHVWASLLGTFLLYGAFTTHYCLALWALWQRRSLRMPAAEATQLVLGFLIPLLLVEHVMTTRVPDSFYDADAGYYVVVLTRLWHDAPDRGFLQLVVLLVAWIHGCIGLRFWLRLKPWYGRAQPLLFAGALLLPTLAILGYFVAGRQVAALAADPAWLAELFRRHKQLAPGDAAHIAALVAAARWGFLGAVAAVLVARILRHRWERRRGIVRLTYPDRRAVEIVHGLSVLEASRSAGIPHASACGGRGRCSTCRIRVEGPPAALPPPAAEEARVLQRIGAAPGIRLACQLRPAGDLKVVPLLPATAQPRDGLRRPGYLQGSEREIAILFADLRAFTHFAEGRLPYDVVFLLNRYFAEMGRAVESAGGRIDKFIGDGVMALFGIESGAAEGCRQALAAARLMAVRLAELNRGLADELDEPLRIGIGIHTGPAIVGEMGYGSAVTLTAVGDAVNTASRLEGLCKTYGCELVVSEDLVRRAGIELGAAPRHEIEIRGRRNLLAIRTLDQAATLPAAAVAAG